MSDSPVSIGPSVGKEPTPDHFALACLMIAYAMQNRKELKVTAQAVHETLVSHHRNNTTTIKSLKKHLDRLGRLGLVQDFPNLGKPHKWRPNLIEVLDHHRVYKITDKGIAVFQMQRNDAIMFKCLRLFESSRTEYGPPRPVVWARHTI